MLASGRAAAAALLPREDLIEFANECERSGAPLLISPRCDAARFNHPCHVLPDLLSSLLRVRFAAR
jgi:hypothetical protein